MTMNLDYIKKKSVFIFDVDGTLYSQKKMRSKMALRLIKYYLSHPTRYKELVALAYFRRFREYSNMTVERAVNAVSDKLGTNGQIVSDTVRKWMFELPLGSPAPRKEKMIIG